MNRVRIGAVTTVEVLDWAGHVRLVVRRVELHAIPARREEDQCMHAVREIVVDEVVSLSPVGVVIGCAAVVCGPGQH